MAEQSSVVGHLRQYGREMIAPADSVILDANERPQGAYLITSGKVRLSLNKPEGLPVWSRIVGEGAILGLSCAIADQRQRIRAKAIEPTHMFFVERDLFANLVKHDPDIRADVLASLMEEVTEMLGAWTALVERVRSLGQ